FRPRPWKNLALGLAACLLFSGLGEAQRARAVPQGELSLTMFDVGQGESLLLELPEGQGLLLDGGGFPGSDFDVGRNVLMPELLARGRRRLEVMALSHPDADHAKGLRYLLDRLPPEELWIGIGTEVHPGFADLKELARSRGVALRVLSQGQRWKFGGADFEVLWPPDHSVGLSDNNSSLVLRVCHFEYCLLLTGDIEAETEAALLRQARETAVLKVAHHGSKTSSTPEFLTAWRPKVALISAGEGNRYRLPHRQVLDELEERGIHVLRTDRDGELRVKDLKASPIPSRWSAIREAVFGSGS
ncbi:MAG TPA: ComEC/Rec2 family competence protein, partial [bacterium]|nr:ComEC/Rec2 family competence protein [bacterium]